MSLNNQRGMGLMDALVGAAMVASLGLAASQMMSGSGNTAKKINIRLEIADFAKHIIRNINSEAACTRTFRELNAKESVVTELIGIDRDGNEFVIVDQNTEYGPMQIRIESMRIVDLPGTEDGAHVVSGDKGTTNLEIKYYFKPGSIYEGRDIRSRITLVIQTDPEDKIVSCSSLSGGGSSLWRRVVGTPNDIYYAAGNVGVGLNNPTQLLDVNGPVSALSDAGPRIELGGGPGFQLVVGTSSPLELFVVPANRAANVEARSVILDGLLHLADSASPCTASNRGSVRFNSGRVQVCEATGWMNKKRGPTMDGYEGIEYGPIPAEHIGCPARPNRYSMDGPGC
jgi:hypothetical protein